VKDHDLRLLLKVARARLREGELAFLKWYAADAERLTARLREGLESPDKTAAVGAAEVLVAAARIASPEGLREALLARPDVVEWIRAHAGRGRRAMRWTAGLTRRQARERRGRRAGPK
jgi:hypothetical protein